MERFASDYDKNGKSLIRLSTGNVKSIANAAKGMRLTGPKLMEHRDILSTEHTEVGHIRQSRRLPVERRLIIPIPQLL